jgi:DNA-binding NarL/FixJ family response regulator
MRRSSGKKHPSGKKHLPARTKKRWTEEQIGILRRLYRTHRNTEIARAVGRTVPSVVFKARRLGLRKGVRRLRQMGQENIRHRWGG